MPRYYRFRREFLSTLTFLKVRWFAWRSVSCAFSFLCSCFFLVNSAIAQSPESARYLNLQAAYIFNIAKFVDWPALGAAETFNICLLGEKLQPLHGVLVSGTKDRKLKERDVKVLLIKRGNDSENNTKRSTSGEGATECQILYMAADPGLPEYRGSVDNAGKRVLRISSPEEAYSKYALVDLVLVNGKIALYINKPELAGLDLEINPALLSVAKIR